MFTSVARGSIKDINKVKDGLVLRYKFKFRIRVGERGNGRT